MTEAEWLASRTPVQMLWFLRGKASDRKVRLFACACVRCIPDLTRDDVMRSVVETGERFADGLATPEELAAAEQAVRTAVAPLMGRFEEYQEFRQQAFDNAESVIQGYNLPREEALAAGERYWNEVLIPAFRDRGYGDSVIATAFPEAQEVHAAQAALAVLSHPSGGEDFFRHIDRTSGHTLPYLPLVTDWTGCKSDTVNPWQIQAILLRDLFTPFHQSPAVDPVVLAWNDGTVRRIAQGIYEERAFCRLPILADALLDAGCDDEELLAHLRSRGPHVRGCWALDFVLGKA